MSSQPIETQLSRLGFNEKEVAVLTALWRHQGGGYPAAIAESIRLPRSTVYRLLDELAVKGAINGVRKGKKLYYQLEDPHALVRVTREQVRVAQRRVDMAEKMLPSLTEMFANLPTKAQVRFFQGKSGVQSVYEDHLNVSKPYEMIAFSNVGRLVDYLSAKFIADYISTKVRKRIKSRGIFPDTIADKYYVKTRYRHVSKTYWPTVRTVPADTFPHEADITVYGEDKVSIINFSLETPTAVIIQDHLIHDMMRMVFELAWKGAAK